MAISQHLSKLRRCASRNLRTILALGMAALLMCCAGTVAAAAESLYRAQAIVTGQGEANRIVGFAVCLEDVLIKVSGALKLAGDPRLEPYKLRANDFVRAYDYHDQMSGTPKRDEQGTRDRPYDLIVDFDKASVNDLLGAIGLKPWLAHRPVLAVFVEMEQGARKFIVTADAKQSDLQREALFAAATKRGVSIVLPEAAALREAGFDGSELLSNPSSRLASVAAAQGGELVLVGHLLWSDQELGWITEWQMDFRGRPHGWQMRGVTFDEAFRRGLGGAAQILSENGDPAS
jgi:uncharacterized protein